MKMLHCLYFWPVTVLFQFRTYSIKAGREGGTLPFVLCDTMGLEEGTKAGLDVNDVTSILKGHMPDGYQVQFT